MTIGENHAPMHLPVVRTAHIFWLKTKKARTHVTPEVFNVKLTTPSVIGYMGPRERRLNYPVSEIEQKRKPSTFDHNETVVLFLTRNTTAPRRVDIKELPSDTLFYSIKVTT